MSEIKISEKKHIIFDFDGTIGDSLRSGIEIFNSIHYKYKLPFITEIEIEEFRNEGIFALKKKLKIPFYRIPLLLTELRLLISGKIDGVHPFEGIPEFLRNIQNKGYKLSILTSNSEENVRRFLHNHDLNIFTDIHGGSGVFNKHRRLKKFLKALGTDKKNAVYVGDEVRDIVSARKLGLPMIAVTWGYNSKVALLRFKPEFVVDTVEELTNLF
ncbi:MAG: HAD-IA family hydrolase [Candidatus Zophobacter franzmannii]|jgi:phosphoglycolate phosphatase|nr:HAD-IA family hydrolase [Candidatus Zophobacter franzmannii]